MASSPELGAPDAADLPAGLALFPATKFMAPPARAEHVRRARCLARIDGPPRAQHVLIGGPAGAGKSTLAAQLVQQVEHAAWVSFAAEDSDVGQFFSALILGIRRTLSDFGDTVLGRLRAGADLTQVLVGLCDELGARSETVTVVLDDLHLIGSPDCIDALEWLLAHAPENLRLVICSRAAPAVRAERLEANGRLAVVRAEDLRFDETESASFLGERLDLELDPDEMHAIHERADGWAVGLYVASLSLRSGVEVAALLDAMTRGERRITSYLVAEALGRADPAGLEFLERAAVLGRFTADLCNAVTGRTDSATRIAELERANMFVIPLDRTGTWFRLHHLFAEMLERRFAERAPDEILRIHAQAAAWHEARGEVPAAIEHLLAARRFEHAADMLAATHALYTVSSRHAGVTARWLAGLPAEMIQTSAPLSIVGAWIAGASGRRGEMRLHLDRALRLPWEGRMPDGSASPAAQAATLYSTFPFGDFPAALLAAREAARLDDPQSPWWPLVEHVRGVWQYVMEGPSEEALDWLQRAGHDAFGTPMVVTAASAPSQASCLLLELGRTVEAEEAYQRSRRSHEIAPSGLASMGYPYSFRARYLRLTGRLEDALAEAEGGAAHMADLPEDSDPNCAGVHVATELGLARLALGDRDGAVEPLRRARELIDRTVDLGMFVRWLEEAERQLRGDSVAPRASAGTGDELSERELAVLRLMAGTLSLREIGAELFVALNTVKTHARSIYRKLDVDSRADAVAAGRDAGLIP